MQGMPSVLVCPIAIDPTPTLVYHAGCASIQDVATAEPHFIEGTHPIKQQRIMPWMACGAILYSFLATVTPQADAQEAAITVAAGTHVSIAYTLRLDEKTVLETNVGSTPLTYVHGAQQIISGLENALEGMKIGESKQVTVPPEKAMVESTKRPLLRSSQTRYRQTRVKLGPSSRVEAQTVRWSAAE